MKTDPGQGQPERRNSLTQNEDQKDVNVDREGKAQTLLGEAVLLTVTTGSSPGSLTLTQAMKAQVRISILPDSPVYLREKEAAEASLLLLYGSV